MRFGHLELPVADPQRSLAFYRDVLGFELVADQGGQFIWVRRGGLELLLLPRARQDRPCPVFYSDALEADVRAWREAGAALERKGRCYHVRDPDGHEFQLVDPTEDHSGEDAGA